MTDPKREGPKPTPGPSMDLDERGDPIPRTRRPSPEAEKFARDWRERDPKPAVKQ